MKKQIVIFITLILMLFSANVFAASTAAAPYKGNTHTYSATVSTSGHNTRWYVATNTSQTRATRGADQIYTITSTADPVEGAWSGTDNAWSGSDVYSVDITWGTGASIGTTYYVFFEVDQDGCTNTMAMEVTVAGDFNVLAYNVTGSTNPSADFPTGATVSDPNIKSEDCPDDIVNPIWDDVNDEHTDAGTTRVIFKVERQFSVVAWQFGYTITDGTNPLTGINSLLIEDEDGTDKETDESNTSGTISMGADQDYAMVYLEMDNVQGATIDIEFNIVIAGDVTNDTDGNVDSSADLATYSIKPIPAITGFGGS